MLEDFWLTEAPDWDEWLRTAPDDALALRFAPESPYYELESHTVPWSVYSPRSEYLVSTQPTLWRTDVLLSVLREPESPWEFEIRGTERFRKLFGGHGVYFQKREWYAHVLRHGHWTEDGMRLLERLPSTETPKLVRISTSSLHGGDHG